MAAEIRRRYGARGGVVARAVSWVVAVAAATGCYPREYIMIQTAQFPEPMIYEDTLEWSRLGSERIKTMHDFEVARELSYAGVATLEGVHSLVPDDENGLIMLTRAWAGIAFAFIDDEREEAQAKDDVQQTEYHRARSLAAAKRARFYGERLIELRAPGFRAAQRNTDTLVAWLRESFPDDEYAEELLWAGVSIVGVVTFGTEDPENVADLWVGIELLRRSIEVAETLEGGLGHTVLGAYYARSAMAELDVAKKHFDRAVEINHGHLLSTKLQLARSYYCNLRDEKSYTALLHEVIDGPDADPKFRLNNVLAKRKARRYLDDPEWQKACGFDLGPAAVAAKAGR